MLVGITTNGKIGLAVMALVFIGFALLASFVFPRRNPDFPGDRLRGFVWVTVLLFVAMMAAVFFLAKEAEGEEHVVEEEVAVETTESGLPPGDTGPEPETEPVETTETEPAETTETEPAETETEPRRDRQAGETETGETGEEPAGGDGDAAAGEEIFAASGCGSCHTLEAAGASGTIGPNLDEAQPDAELVVERVTNGMGAMPSFADSLNEQQIADVAAYVVESTSG